MASDGDENDEWSGLKDIPVVRIEVVPVKSGVPLVERILYGGDFLKKKQYQLFELEYSLDHAEELEFRVFFFAQTTVLLDQIALSGTMHAENDDKTGGAFN